MNLLLQSVGEEKFGKWIDQANRDARNGALLRFMHQDKIRLLQC